MLLSYAFYLGVAGIALVLKLNFLVFTVLFTVPPILYFGLKLKNHFKNAIIESLVIAVPLEIIWDSLAHLSKSWYVYSLFGIRIFGDIPVDDFIWSILFVLLVITTYEYFFDHYKSSKLAASFKKMVLFFLLALAVFISVFKLFPQVLVIPYFYAWLMAGLFVFTVYGLLRHPQLYQNVSLAALYFFLPSVLCEVVALKVGHWYFEAGYHVGYLTVGDLSVPFEEFLFYFLAITAIAMIHELFCDNRRN